MPKIFLSVVFFCCSIVLFAQGFDEYDWDEIDSSDETSELSAEGKIEPYDLRLEFLAEPKGIDELKPRFSWKLRCVENLEEGQRNGQCQSAYRIVVYKTKRTSPTLSQPVDTVWDSGRVASTSQLVEYAGKPLEPQSEYTWTLTVWDKPTNDEFIGKKEIDVNYTANQPTGITTWDDEPVAVELDKRFFMGRPSEIAVATFSTGIFSTDTESNPWKGKWIGLDKFSLEENEEEKNSLTLDRAAWIWYDDKGLQDAPVGKVAFRNTFSTDPLPYEISASLVDETGPIGFENLQSAQLVLTADNSFTAYLNGKKVGSGSNFKSAQVFDVTKLLLKGKNVLAVEADNRGDAPNPAGVLGLLRMVLEGHHGIRVMSFIGTNDSWKAAEGWSDEYVKPDFDDSDWKSAVKIADSGDAPWGKVGIGAAWPSPPARYLNKIVKVNTPLVRATAYVVGLGYYELRLNGKKIGDHQLDPVLTDYDKRVPYVVYEIDPKLFTYGEALRVIGININKNDRTPISAAIGTNWIQVILGNGRFYAPRSKATRTFGYPKMLFQLELEYGDGTVETIVSDESWLLSTDGPIRDNNDYDGEIYDARKNARGKAAKASIVEAPKGKLVSQMMPPMRVVEEFEPVSILQPKRNVWVFDFGVNLVGNCSLLIPEGLPEGTKIQIHHAETLRTSGPHTNTLYRDNLRSALCRDIYIASGKERKGDTYTPTFTYHGFRYAELSGLPKDFKPTKETLTARAINTDLPKVGKFKTSNETINAVYRNIVRGTQDNYLSIPTDCPQRDERQGWLGDRAGVLQGEMYLFDNITLFSKWLRDIEDSQRKDGNLSDVCPNYWPLYTSNVTWPSAFTFMPDTIHTMYGDRRPIERHYDAMRRWLIDHLGKSIKDGIIEADRYGDWCVPPENPKLIHSKDSARKTSKEVLATAYYIHNLNLLRKYAIMLGKSEDFKDSCRKAQAMRKAFNEKFLDKENGKYDNGTQTSCVLPLYFGIVPEPSAYGGTADKVFETLVKNIETVTDNHIGTGVIGGQWINRVLSDNGRADISYRFATNKTYPSWGYMVEKGATTIWELWNGDTANPAMNSGNHVMLVGDLTIWYYEYLAGIKPDPQKPGFEHIIMKPTVVGDLKFVDAEYDSVRGPIKSRWERNDDKFRWEIEIPVGSTATVYVPGGETYENIPSGKHVFESKL